VAWALAEPWAADPQLQCAPACADSGRARTKAAAMESPAASDAERKVMERKVMGVSCETG